MYGGHIRDFFDMRTIITQMSLILNPSILNSGVLVPGLEAPYPGTFNYSRYSDVIADSLPMDSPPLYGIIKLCHLMKRCTNVFFFAQIYTTIFSFILNKFVLKNMNCVNVELHIISAIFLFSSNDLLDHNFEFNFFCRFISQFWIIIFRGKSRTSLPFSYIFKS